MTERATRVAPASVLDALPVSVAGPTEMVAQVLRALHQRGLQAAELAPTGAGALAELAVYAHVVDGILDPTTAVALSQVHRPSSALGETVMPTVILAPPPTTVAAQAASEAAALAYLRAHGAIVTHDPDVWLEVIVALARHPLPAGPHIALIASEHSWLGAQARTLTEGDARPLQWLVAGHPSRAQTDIVLFDFASGVVPARQVAPDAVWVPVLARSELLTGVDGLAKGVLFGARTAVLALSHVGAAAGRIAAGLGPAPRGERAELEVDEEKLARQLDRVLPGDPRMGDHETKAMLSAYGVPITRQAVATTASAALRVAKRAGFPVEMKPWGHDVPSERVGCPLATGLATGADVRRAFSEVLRQAGRSELETEGAAVIVREAAPRGRELYAVFTQLPAVGWTTIVGGHGMLAPVAAPAPLRLIDAQGLAAHLLASRAAEAEPDRVALANLLRRASHVAVDLGHACRRLELARIVVGARGERTAVVDAFIEWQPR